MESSRKRKTAQPEAGSFGADWPAMAPSKVEASRIAHISRKTIDAHQAEGADGFNPDGSVDLWKYRAWLVAHGKRVLERSPSMESARLRKLLAEAAMAEHRLEEMRGKFVLKDAVVAKWVAVTDMARATILNYNERILPPQIVGLDIPAIVVRMRDASDAVLRELQKGFYATVDLEHPDQDPLPEPATSPPNSPPPPA